MGNGNSMLSRLDPSEGVFNGSPRLLRRPALEPLRPETTVQARAPRETDRPDADGSFTVFNAAIPNAQTDCLIRCEPDVLDNALNGIMAQAMLNTEQLGVPFMVFKDGRSCLMTLPGGERTYYTDPALWKYDMLRELAGHHIFDIFHLVAINRPETPEPPSIEQELTKAERNDLADLESRSRLQKLDMLPISLSEEELLRLTELRGIGAGKANAAPHQKHDERPSLIHSANEKARKVLGVFTDHSKIKNENEDSSIDSRKDQKARKKFSMFSHGHFASRSMTDVSSPANDDAKKIARNSRRSVDMLRDCDETTPRQRNFFNRKRSTYVDSRSEELLLPSNGVSNEAKPNRREIKKSDVRTETEVATPTNVPRSVRRRWPSASRRISKRRYRIHPPTQ